MLPRRSRQVLPTVHRAADPGGDAHWAVRSARGVCGPFAGSQVVRVGGEPYDHVADTGLVLADVHPERFRSRT